MLPSEELYHRLEVLRRAADVERCHTMKTLQRQTVGHHSFNVAILVSYLALDEPAMDMGRLIQASLVHDLPEVFTGDVPANAKWSSEELEMALRILEGRFKDQYQIHVKLTDEERRLVKFADAVELLLFCIDEIRLGNSFVKQVAMRVFANLNKRGFPNDACRQLFITLEGVYRDVVSGTHVPADPHKLDWSESK